MSNWKPTEGLTRAELTVQMLEADAPGCGVVLNNPAFRWRMVQIIAGAIDSALADGSEADALASVVGNGGGPYRITSPVSAAMLEMEGMVPAGATAQLIMDNEIAAMTAKVPKKRGPKKGSKRKPRADKQTEASAE